MNYNANARLVSFYVNDEIREKSDKLLASHKEDMMFKDKDCKDEFRDFFYNVILDKAIEITLSNPEERGCIHKNVIALLNEDTLRSALEAFSKSNKIM